ncbi:hypothetical protein [Brachybacterium sp. ACRRE]|uniref:hypothetical protein n=1 Tax=Brachybacterium sp. ACRRE TaxID=2918184 RepID=UPI001EF1FA10|nr:hypothetical protein [Brachybacterium sp. ACRRE]MCG7309843.1 hypothetical protein [Brachybacterium sp. ACRRE]
MQDTTERGPFRRRALLATAAWVAPTAVAATAAPALAASAERCTPDDDGQQVVPSGTSWSVVSGELKTDENETGWLDIDEFRSWDNNASTTEDAVLEAVRDFTARAGATYEVTLAVTVGVGNSPIGRDRQRVQIDAVQGASESKIVWVNATNVWAEDMPGYVNQYTWDGSPVTYSATFTAAETGPAVLRLRFTLAGTPDVNDDIWVRQITTQQIACAA